MNRRALLSTGAAFALGSLSGIRTVDAAARRAPRVRPGDTAWPNPAAWERLNGAVGGRLMTVDFPLAACISSPGGQSSVDGTSGAPDCAALFERLRNPFYIGDTVGLTETLGWVDAWTSRPSAYAVAARTSADVAAAVNFARDHRLRLVVKGGGHSYLGQSNAPDSLMIWTRAMNGVELHDAFTPQGFAGKAPPEPAVSVGAGAMWMQVYQAVTTRGLRYVQGGGCTTVGVAGLVQSGGFGSFSKAFGTAAGNLLEAEVVTADGVVRIANPCTNPDLFFALKGGGGGSFGVVTRVTLRTHALPQTFGAVQAKITAASDAAYRALIAKVVDVYRTALINPHWGEQIRFSGRKLTINMVFQGLSQAEAQAVWRPFFDWVAAAGADYVGAKPTILALPAKLFWDPKVMKALPGVVKADDRPGAPKDTFFWAGDGEQVGQVLHAYQSVWLPKDLLAPERQGALVDALYAAADAWGVGLHFNKGLAGAPEKARAWAGDTATNPAVLDAFALAIIAANEPPAYPGVPGHEPDVAAARRHAAAVTKAIGPLKRLAPSPAAYLSESDYFQGDWKRAYWGAHAPRLEAIKRRYDPDGLFVVHHGIGSDGWSADGFTPV